MNPHERSRTSSWSKGRALRSAFASSPHSPSRTSAWVEEGAGKAEGDAVSWLWWTTCRRCWSCWRFHHQGNRRRHRHHRHRSTCLPRCASVTETLHWAEHLGAYEPLNKLCFHIVRFSILDRYVYQNVVPALIESVTINLWVRSLGVDAADWGRWFCCKQNRRMKPRFSKNVTVYVLFWRKKSLNRFGTGCCSDKQMLLRCFAFCGQVDRLFRRTSCNCVLRWLATGSSRSRAAFGRHKSWASISFQLGRRQLPVRPMHRRRHDMSPCFRPLRSSAL